MAIDRRPVRISARPTRLPPPAPSPSGPPSQAGWTGCAVVLAIVVLLAMVGRCSSTGSGTGSTTNASSTETPGNAQQVLVSAVGAQTPVPVKALDAAAVRRGSSRVALAAKEGLAGEMIYSQNCYDALGRAFSWAKLDECGAFDLSAVARLGDRPSSGAEKEVAWFGSEEAAGRYLKSATAAGEEASAADARQAALQARLHSGRSAPPRRRAAQERSGHPRGVDPQGAASPDEAVPNGAESDVDR